ncbi:MAG: type II toxin-antitoxin system VapC family toxin [Acidobacteria bacterium]|nr:type II toxin-antitoxin system VapC family toxin [Acidobacteriota bacterium]
MIGLDTNVLIRYFTQDDQVQAAKAARIIDAAPSAGLFISSVVICEIVWVLEDSYRHKRKEISEVLETMLQTGQFAFENKDLLWQALRDYRRGKGDLSDYLIGRVAHRAGCSHTLTFDAALKTSDLFRLL